MMSRVAMVLRRFCAVIAAFMLLCATPPGLAQVYQFTGGRWFNGESFESKTVYCVDGVFRFETDRAVDETFDLSGGYVVPPFGEAHNHDLSSASVDEIGALINQYLRHGVFYVKVQSAFSTTIPRIRHTINKPESVDAVFAYAPVTGPGGHPIRLREAHFDRGQFEGIFGTKDEIAGIGYTLVRDERELDAQWPRLLSQKPDFIKFMLSSSEEYAYRRDDPAFFGQKGLDPALAPALVRKAHEAGLRITAHIETGPDFFHAVSAGVDEIAHMPGAREPQVIREEDARLAARRSITVISTLMLSKKIEDVYPAWYERSLLPQHRANLRVLRDAGVTIAVGSDMPYRDTSRGEALLLHSLGVFTGLEVLKMWCENSPRTIFPERRIARIADGYEASFLVLEGNPLEDFGNVTRISRRFKQGVWLEVPEPEAEEDDK